MGEIAACRLRTQSDGKRRQKAVKPMGCERRPGQGFGYDPSNQGNGDVIQEDPQRQHAFLEKPRRRKRSSSTRPNTSHALRIAASRWRYSCGHAALERASPQERVTPATTPRSSASSRLPSKAKGTWIGSHPTPRASSCCCLMMWISQGPRLCSDPSRSREPRLCPAQGDDRVFKIPSGQGNASWQDP